MTESFEITKIKENKRQTVEDMVVREIPLTLIIDDTELVTLLCCPNDLEDLVTGFLFTSGIIRGCEDIKNVVINNQQWIANVALAGPKLQKDLVFKRLYTSGCGKGTLFYSPADIANRRKISSDIKVETTVINNLTAEFQKRSSLYLKTGGVHSAAFAEDSSIRIFKEDIGRHNAIDKVIGRNLTDKKDFKNSIMITSGRISSEVLLKIQKCGIPIIVSKSAPTDQAVKLARDMDVTLIGFARGTRMNIYSREERII